MTITYPYPLDTSGGYGPSFFGKIHEIAHYIQNVKNMPVQDEVERDPKTNIPFDKATGQYRIRGEFGSNQERIKIHRDQTSNYYTIVIGPESKQKKYRWFPNMAIIEEKLYDEGSIGRIYVGLNLVGLASDHTKPCVFKVFKLPNEDLTNSPGQNMPAAMADEKKCLDEFNRFQFAYLGTHYKAISQDFLPGLNLKSFIFEREHSERSRKYQPISEKINLLLKIAKAVKELHEKRIVHRDLKFSNMVFNPTTQDLYICDFELSKKVGEQDRNSYGIPVFKSPEHFTKTTTTASDIYSLSRIIALLIAYPEYNYTEDGQLKEMCQTRTQDQTKQISDHLIAKLEKSYSKEGPLKTLLALVTRMADPSPENRPTIAQVINKLQKIQVKLQADTSANLRQATQEFITPSSSPTATPKSSPPTSPMTHLYKRMNQSMRPGSDNESPEKKCQEKKGVYPSPRQV